MGGSPSSVIELRHQTFHSYLEIFSLLDLSFDLHRHRFCTQFLNICLSSLRIRELTLQAQSKGTKFNLCPYSQYYPQPANSPSIWLLKLACQLHKCMIRTNRDFWISLWENCGIWMSPFHWHELRRQLLGSKDILTFFFLLYGRYLPPSYFLELGLICDRSSVLSPLSVPKICIDKFYSSDWRWLALAWWRR